MKKINSQVATTTGFEPVRPKSLDFESNPLTTLARCLGALNVWSSMVVYIELAKGRDVCMLWTNHSGGATALATARYFETYVGPLMYY